MFQVEYNCCMIVFAKSITGPGFCLAVAVSCGLQFPRKCSTLWRTKAAAALATKSKWKCSMVAIVLTRGAPCPRFDGSIDSFRFHWCAQKCCSWHLAWVSRPSTYSRTLYDTLRTHQGSIICIDPSTLRWAPWSVASGALHDTIR